MRIRDVLAAVPLLARFLIEESADAVEREDELSSGVLVRCCKHDRCDDCACDADSDTDPAWQ